MTRVAVLAAAHSRREKTVAALTSLAGQADVDDVDVEVFLLDDASTDGTARAVTERFPDAHVLSGNGHRFWSGGMRDAWSAARTQGGFDHYVWLNDDVVLDPDALRRVLDVHDDRIRAGLPLAIVAGATRDPDSGVVTYGGVTRPSRLRPLAFELEPSHDQPHPVDTMNGQWVLVPAPVAETVGGLEPRFVHGFGDYDYGLRARRAGFEVVVAPGTIGTCPRNPVHRAGDLTLREELRSARRITGGLPQSDWRRFARRWSGVLWPLYWASPYVRRMVRAAQARVGRPT